MSSSQFGSSHRGVDFGILNVQATGADTSAVTSSAHQADNDDSWAALQSYNGRVRGLSQQALPGFGNLGSAYFTEISATF